MKNSCWKSNWYRTCRTLPAYIMCQYLVRIQVSQVKATHLLLNALCCQSSSLEDYVLHSMFELYRARFVVQNGHQKKP